MIINSIIVKNFQCFYDEVKFEFNEGLNFVLAANGHGKSKLFDAFYWVINNSIIGSDGRPIPTSEVKHNLINKKALMVAENNESIKTKVILEFEHNSENYQISRNYGTIKTKNNNS